MEKTIIVNVETHNCASLRAPEQEIIKYNPTWIV